MLEHTAPISLEATTNLHLMSNSIYLGSDIELNWVLAVTQDIATELNCLSQLPDQPHMIPPSKARGTMGTLRLNPSEWERLTGGDQRRKDYKQANRHHAGGKLPKFAQQLPMGTLWGHHR